MIESLGKGRAAAFALAAIFLLAFLVRLPGVFWGYGFQGGLTFTGYHRDEPHMLGMEKEFANGVTDEKAYYPKGFGFQMALIFRAADRLASFRAPNLCGRLLSALYGAATTLIVFALARGMTGRALVAPAAALFLALAGLHVTESHYATADAGNTFWLYLVLLCCLRFVRGGRWPDLALGAAAVGIGLSLKMNWVLLPPLAYALARRKSAPGRWAAALAGVALFFWAGNGGRYTFGNFRNTLRNVTGDNLNVIQDHDNLMNLPVYAAEAVAGVGLPVFALAVLGAVLALRGCGRARALLANDGALLVGGATLLHLLSISFLDLPFARHILPAVPALALLAAYGFARVRELPALAGRRQLALLAGVLAYQAVYVASVERYYVRDTRETAWEWIRENIPAGSGIFAAPYVIMPQLGQRYREARSFDAPYVVLHEAYYYRYRRSEITPLRDYPSWPEIYHGNRAHLAPIQRLLRGEGDRVLLKRFEVSALTPELYLFKRVLGTYPLFVGDVLVFGPARAPAAVSGPPAAAVPPASAPGAPGPPPASRRGSAAAVPAGRRRPPGRGRPA